MAGAADMRNGGLLVVGELCVDIVVALTDAPVRYGQHEQLVTSTVLTMGSSSAITACGAAALGVPTSMVGVCGDDEFGSYLVRELARRGVGTSAVRVDPTAPTGSSTHLTRPGGDRAILTVMGSIGRTVASDITDELLAGAAHLHGGSWFLQESLWADGPQLWKRARAAGLTTSLDGNFDPTEQWDCGIIDILAHTDVFFGNEQELCGITGASGRHEAIEAALDRMPAHAVVVCKLGADGAIACWREGSGTTGVHAGVPAGVGALVDTIGAGDSLTAGFLAAKMGGSSIEECLRLGVACGTASTRSAGGVDAQPSRAEADALAAGVPTHRSR